MHLLPVLPLPLAAATVEAAAATIFTFVKNWERKGLKEKEVVIFQLRKMQ